MLHPIEWQPRLPSAKLIARIRNIRFVEDIRSGIVESRRQPRQPVRDPD
jgi:hypothetical protein